MNSGKDTILLVQPHDAAIGTDGFIIGNLTDNNYSIENEIVDEQTKFGRIVAYGPNSEAFELTCYGQTGDPGQVAVLNAIRKKKQLKVWEVDLNLKENDMHHALFAYTIVESVGKESPQDGFQEISATLQVLGEAQEGELPKLPDSVIEFARYGFEKPGEKTGELGAEQPPTP
ncbi:phage major tail protein, TP901-1 family [Bacillus sp. JJ722]|uniref:phage major tail protein, TP901-1 family n=1 Tax=Bacillus sp. JJ722 TaxID=3122973 RepID=UPI002FFEEF3C